MKCVAHYRKRYADPAFLFTPDAEFPVCYGEKGIYTADFSSATIADGAIVELSGGQAYNAVPSSAHATIRLNNDMRRRAHGCLEAREGVTFCINKDGALEVEAIGRSAHASTPEGGINAIGRLVNFILDFELGTADELAFLRILSAIMVSTDGSGIGIATSDDDFGALTLVGGKISLIAEGEAKRIVQGIDIRYPTSTNAVQLDDAFEKLGGKIGAKIEHVKVIKPFMVNANAPEIQVMINTFNEVTGLERKPFTMGGGTYAREFSRGASFGPEMPWEDAPEWAGAMHGPNEAVSIELLKTALKIYILTIGRLAKVLGE
jgi:succinyl-diaminopimelate desuccinylase